jgi:hypothetical protein
MLRTFTLFYALTGGQDAENSRRIFVLGGDVHRIKKFSPRPDVLCLGERTGAAEPGAAIGFIL